jgi:hypothetical protein
MSLSHEIMGLMLVVGRREGLILNNINVLAFLSFVLLDSLTTVSFYCISVARIDDGLIS